MQRNLNQDQFQTQKNANLAIIQKANEEIKYSHYNHFNQSSSKSQALNCGSNSQSELLQNQFNFNPVKPAKTDWETSQKNLNLKQGNQQDSLSQFANVKQLSGETSLFPNMGDQLPPIQTKVDEQNSQMYSHLNQISQSSHLLDFSENQQTKEQVKHDIPTKAGGCNSEERHQKIKKYLEKRKNRNYTKKISYDCRKKVAENRIRIKGRFVNKHTAQILKNQNSSNLQMSNEDQQGEEEFKDQNSKQILGEMPQAKRKLNGKLDN